MRLGIEGGGELEGVASGRKLKNNEKWGDYYANVTLKACSIKMGGISIFKTGGINPAPTKVSRIL